MAPTDPKNQHLSPLTTQWHNRSKNSVSSVNSDGATSFHSTRTTHFSNSHTNIELENQIPMSSKPLPLSSPPKQPTSPQKQTPYIQEPRLESIKMDRTDSGYEDGAGRSSTEGKDTSSRRQSTTSSTHTATKEKKERRESRNPSSPRTSTSDVRPKNRPTQRRNPRSPSSVSSNTSSTAGNGPRRSTSEWRAGAPRPSLHARHTTPYHRTTSSSQYPNSYFHFPPIQLTNEPSSHEQENEAPLSPHSPPPATVQYWTSDSTRRLEYAAIDAASKGVRGFVIKLIPDCFLPGKVKRRRFHDVDADDASDAGSVRRYRLNLPEENVDKELQDVTVKTEEPKRPFLRRWTTLGGKGKAKSS